MDEDLNIDKSALAGNLDVQLSTGSLTKYDITKYGLLDCRQRLWISKYEMLPVSDGKSEKSPIK